jgi:rod shape-determining protein MreC
VPSFFSNKRLIILLVSMITMVVVVGVTMKERPNPTMAEQFLRDSIGTLQSLVYRPARSVAGFFENVMEINTLYTENQRLKASLEDYAVKGAKIKELEAENVSLKELLKAESNLGDYQTQAAQVIMRSPDRWHHQVTINRGQKHGVEADMAVITSKGMVGRVRSVAQFSSVVELLSDANRMSNVSAVVQGNEMVFGVVEGYDFEKEALFFRKVPIDAPLEEGQTVITSGLGGLYPRGLYIGSVIEIIPDEYGLTQSALIKPAANLYQLDYVFVVERSFLPMKDSPIEKNGEESGNGEEKESKGGSDS